jgi:hypothetical protein
MASVTRRPATCSNPSPENSIPKTRLAILPISIEGMISAATNLNVARDQIRHNGADNDEQFLAPRPEVRHLVDLELTHRRGAKLAAI